MNNFDIKGAEETITWMSQRKYYRIKQNGINVIFCNYPNDLVAMKNAFIFWTYKLKENNINVPLIIWNYDNGLLIQDLWDNTLDKYFNNIIFKKHQIICKQVFEAVEKIHNIQITHNKKLTKTGKMNINFFLKSASELLDCQWYCKLWLQREWMAKYLSYANDLIDIESINYTYWISDFQSRNIIIKDNIPYLIDYQDIRYLTPELDFWAFISDSYVDYSKDELLQILYLINNKKYNYHKIIGWGIIKLFHAIRLYLLQVYNKNNSAYITPLENWIKRIYNLEKLLYLNI